MTHQFTVVLRKPDYITTDDLERYVVHHVEAPSAKDASTMAAVLEWRNDSGCESGSMHDYLPLFIFEGRPKLAALGFNL